MFLDPLPTKRREIIGKVRFWVFDLDGTITVPVHDFDAARRALGVPPGVDLLHHVAALPPGPAAEARRWLADWEHALADAAVLQDDAAALLAALRAAGRPWGVLTRNTRATAARTLASIGLVGRAGPGIVIGREDAPPKPAPDGVQAVLAALGGVAAEAVMVGDYVYDSQAGRAAGALTVLVRRPGGTGAPPGAADLEVDDLRALLPVEHP
jgi:phosphoglycolate phosphatase-like HAD superfamily hydrolase